jgi:hypothetical protein
MSYSYALAKRVRAEHLKELQRLAPNIAPTFNFGYRTSSISAQAYMTRFFSVAQREVYGRNWSKQYDRVWPIAYGYFESPDTNPHYHVLAKVESRLADWIEQHGPAAWKNIAKRGQLEFCEIYGPDGAWSYWTKRLVTKYGSEERWIYKDTRPCAIGQTKLKPGKESGWL